MGSSPDATLFYGYVWKDDDVEFETDLDSLVEANLRGLGIPDPWEARPEDLTDYAEWRLANKVALDFYHASLRQIKDSFLVDWGQFGNLEYYSGPYLYVKGTERSTWLGAIQIDSESLVVNPVWGILLNEFLATQEIDRPHPKPGWFIVASYG